MYIIESGERDEGKLLMAVSALLLRDTESCRSRESGDRRKASMSLALGASLEYTPLLLRYIRVSR